jgi:hypothetical protein
MMGDHLVRFGEGSSTNAFNMCLEKNKYIDIYRYIFIHSIQLHEGLSAKHVLPLYFQIRGILGRGRIRTYVENLQQIYSLSLLTTRPLSL